MTSKKSLVLVDDDKDILTVFKKGLEAGNYQVYAFDNPIQALEYVKSSASGPRLLISDIRLPTMTGFEIYKHEFDKVFPSSDIDALISKPISIINLIDIVNAIIAGNKKDL